MAKISARGATEVAREVSDIKWDDNLSIRYTHVLRSDRAVLRKANVDSSYRIVGRIPSSVTDEQLVPFFHRYVKRFVAARS